MRARLWKLSSYNLYAFNACKFVSCTLVIIGVAVPLACTSFRRTYRCLVTNFDRTSEGSVLYVAICGNFLGTPGQLGCSSAGQTEC